MAPTRELSTGCARRSPDNGSEDGGSTPPTSTVEESTTLALVRACFDVGTLSCRRLLLDQVDDGHDRGRLRQFDAQLLHDRPEVRQELVERLLALPDIEDLKLAIFTEA